MARGGELNQVWTNLIDNAIGATNGSGTIQLITRSENNHVMVEIADDGPGIPDEYSGARSLSHFSPPRVSAMARGWAWISAIASCSNTTARSKSHSQPGLTRFIVRLPIGASPAASDSSH